MTTRPLLADAHPWVSSYPAGVRWDAPLARTPVPQLLEEAVAQWPERPFLDFMGRRISYREFGALVDRAAAGFQKLGVGPGVHVGLYLPNSPHYPIAFFGVLRAGGTVVNYSPLDAERVLEHKVEDSESDFLVTLDLAALYPQMARLMGHSRLKRLIVGALDEYAGAPGPTRAQMQGAGLLAPMADDAHHMTFAQLLDNDGRHEYRPVADPADAIAALQYTGGTTGLPKGAMLTHGNLTAACAQYVESLSGNEAIVAFGEERILAVLPLFHIYSLVTNLLMGIRLGAEIILHTRFELDTVMKTFDARKITVFSGVPTMYMAMIGHPKAGELDLRSLRSCGSGGAPLPVEVAQKFFALTGCQINEGWGMTETSPTGSFTPARGRRKAGSCGMPLPGITLSMRDLVDPDQEMPLGQRGELCISGPNVMKGYWKNEAATRASMTGDGFFRSGDVAYMDEDGFVFIVDRTKDMLLCGGFNVYPRTIEDAIYEHPSVEEVSVIGIHDDYRGQSPKAFIKLRSGAEAFTLDELKRFLKDRLGKHEMLQAMEIRAELPKTAVGKLSKKELYDEENARRDAGTSGATVSSS
ncbi:long-chain-fatty-acid--CoA ligase [Variovorax sp. IB41]|uniref:long-chain-fatty-acid--CoA ligase n=1 Tax=Variovorax sp. IB41 TaxID=2779370 RepID=UPI0018E726D4|nr:long-chain fatty acid--CoA ligase [Variovorax sp. IB41]MBJ2159049.1 long-chain fatty acid--CoA ligase [Variovorax sp. IB41]